MIPPRLMKQLTAKVRRNLDDAPALLRRWESLHPGITAMIEEALVAEDRAMVGA